MKIDEMADVFLNLANFAQHSLLTLAPPRGYTLNLKLLIKVSKVSWTSQLSYKVLWSSFDRNFRKDFISLKKTPPKSPVQLGLRYTTYLESILKTWSGLTPLLVEDTCNRIARTKIDHRSCARSCIKSKLKFLNLTKLRKTYKYSKQLKSIIF